MSFISKELDKIRIFAPKLKICGHGGELITKLIKNIMRQQNELVINLRSLIEYCEVT
jgi:hypothetical protein